MVNDAYGREAFARSTGRMLWFNEEKGLGKIESDDGERLTVVGDAFVGGHPVGRCADLAVVFDVEGENAVNVERIEVSDVRRARRRSSGRSL